VAYRSAVARAKRAAFREAEYWGKPLPGFGDPAARLLIIGLAPAAHGGNRTGRMFTGDRSGDWLYEALYRYGFASQPLSTDRTDGLRLVDAYITAAARCAPPQNRPTRDELLACRPFLIRELELLPSVRVVVALGRVALDAYLAASAARGSARVSPRPSFAHGAVWDLRGLTLIASYHPSQRNTFTGLLTRPMFHNVFAQARRVLDGQP
jgi:uracil-DNA glycosylase family 4